MSRIPLASVLVAQTQERASGKSIRPTSSCNASSPCREGIPKCRDILRTTEQTAVHGSIGVSLDLHAHLQARELELAFFLPSSLLPLISRPRVLLPHPLAAISHAIETVATAPTTTPETKRPLKPVLPPLSPALDCRVSIEMGCVEITPPSLVA